MVQLRLGRRLTRQSPQRPEMADPAGAGRDATDPLGYLVVGELLGDAKREDQLVRFGESLERPAKCCFGRRRELGVGFAGFGDVCWQLGVVCALAATQVADGVADEGPQPRGESRLVRVVSVELLDASEDGLLDGYFEVGFAEPTADESGVAQEDPGRGW